MTGYSRTPLTVSKTRAHPESSEVPFLVSPTRECHIWPKSKYPMLARCRRRGAGNAIAGGVPGGVCRRLRWGDNGFPDDACGFVDNPLRGHLLAGCVRGDCPQFHWRSSRRPRVQFFLLIADGGAAGRPGSARTATNPRCGGASACRSFRRHQGHSNLGQTGDISTLGRQKDCPAYRRSKIRLQVPNGRLAESAHR